MREEDIRSVANEMERWRGIQKRCSREKGYADRKIKMCKEWQGREGFVKYYQHISQLEHFGEPGYSLDRIDFNGNYEPGNVRWATSTEQARNRRSTHFDDGESLPEIAIKTNIPVDTIRRRYSVGDRGDRLRRPLLTNRHKKGFIDNNQSLLQISRQLHISIGTLRARYRSGDRGDRLRRPSGTKKDAYSQELTRPTCI